MATSGTVAFRPNIEEIIAESFERCGIDPQTRTGHHAKSARRSLNLLFSEFANRGINYWTITQNTLTLANGTSNYTVPVGTIDILDAVIREDDIDQIVNRITIQEYNQIPNKTDTGKPSQYMLDRQYTPVIYFWNVPDKAYTIVYEYYSMGYDLENALDVPSLPEQYRFAIVDGAMYYAFQFRGDTQAADVALRKFEDQIKNLRIININRTPYLRDRRVSF